MPNENEPNFYRQLGYWIGLPLIIIGMAIYRIYFPEKPEE